jgi:hypothetical protein
MKHIDLGLVWKERAEMPRLRRILAGVEWMCRANKQGRLRMAITFDILVDVLKCKLARELQLRKSGQSVDIYSTGISIPSLKLIRLANAVMLNMESLVIIWSVLLLIFYN